MTFSQSERQRLKVALSRPPHSDKHTPGDRELLSRYAAACAPSGRSWKALWRVLWMVAVITIVVVAVVIIAFG